MSALREAIDAALRGRDPRLVDRCDVAAAVAALEDYGIYDALTFLEVSDSSHRELQHHLGGIVPPSFLALLRREVASTVHWEARALPASAHEPEAEQHGATGQMPVPFMVRQQPLSRPQPLSHPQPLSPAPRPQSLKPGPRRVTPCRASLAPAASPEARASTAGALRYLSFVQPTRRSSSWSSWRLCS